MYLGYSIDGHVICFITYLKYIYTYNVWLDKVKK